MTRKEEIEEAALNYGHNNPNGHWNADAEYEEDYEAPFHDFRAGAEWADAHPVHYDGQAMLHVLQKGVKQGKKQALEKFEKNRLEHCDNITEEQYNLESNFVNNHLEKHHRIPTILDAIEYGLEKGKKEMLEKAIEWLEENLPISDLENEHYVVFTNENKRNFIENLKKTMEGQI